MATSLDAVFSSFLSKVTDYDLAEMMPEDANSFLRDLLLQATVRFAESCKQDLTIADDDIAGDLSVEEIDILSDIMCESWLKPKLNNLDWMRQRMNTKDFTQFSPANQLAQVRETYKEIHDRAESKVRRYSYVHNNVGDLV